MLRVAYEWKFDFSELILCVNGQENQKNIVERSTIYEIHNASW